MPQIDEQMTKHDRAIFFDKTMEYVIVLGCSGWYLPEQVAVQEWDNV